MRCPNLADLPPPPLGKIGWPWTVETPQAPDAMEDGSPWLRIGIVTPSFKQGQFIEETIRSVLLQGYPNLEYILMDGGSIDGSVDIIKQYEPWLTYWTSERDGGQADAINQGFSVCTGELLAFLNSDDLYAIGALQEVVAAWGRAGRPRDALISGRVQDMSPEGSPLPQIFEPTRIGTLKEWVFGGISLHQPGCFWTAETWRRFGPFPSDLRYMFDRYFFSRIAAQGETSFLIANELISFVRLHQECKTMSELDKFAPEWGQAIERLRTELSFRHRLGISLLQWEKANWEFASRILAESDPRCARRLLVRHIMRDPGSILLRPILGAARRLTLQNNS